MGSGWQGIAVIMVLASGPGAWNTGETYLATYHDCAVNVSLMALHANFAAIAEGKGGGQRVTRTPAPSSPARGIKGRVWTWGGCARRWCWSCPWMTSRAGVDGEWDTLGKG